MALHFVLDGYNLIKQTPALAERCLEEGRTALLALIEKEGLRGSPRNAVTVVFDGQQGLGGCPSGENPHVIFTSWESADDKIKRLVDEAPNRKNIVVVTEDREIKYYVRAAGAQVLGVREFLNRMKTQGKHNAPPPADKKYIPSTVEDNITSEMEKIWLDQKKKDRTP